MKNNRIYEKVYIMNRKRQETKANEKSMIHLLFSAAVFFAVNRTKECKTHNKLGSVNKEPFLMCFVVFPTGHYQPPNDYMLHRLCMLYFK